MSSSPYGFLYNPSLPSEETIVAHCLSLGIVRGTTIVDPSTTSVIAWIKYGPNVDIDEACMQDWTTKALRDAGASDIQAPHVFHAFTADYYGCSIGYIAMEYIEGIDCDSNNVELVAKAVQVMIGLQAPPTTILKHIGGGTRSIVHSFFPEWLPNVNYKSDQDFYDHIHGVSVCQRLKVLWRTQSYVRSLNSCASIFMAIYLATADSSVLPILTRVTSGSVRWRMAG
jgi:hypothetical protein